LGAIDSIAAQRDGYSPRCSCTMRTARARISGEKLFDFMFMDPSSQSLEPPQDPGRFMSYKAPFPYAWNFGPKPKGNRYVREVLTKLKVQWPQLDFHISHQNQPHKVKLVHLDSSKARNHLQWEPVWNIYSTRVQKADWYRAWLNIKEIFSAQQFAEYAADAKNSHVDWACS